MGVSRFISEKGPAFEELESLEELRKTIRSRQRELDGVTFAFST